MTYSMRRLEINGGRVEEGPVTRLLLDPVQEGYADAQIDDYGEQKRSEYPWHPGTRLELQARFSHPLEELVGTAGFGFWNAPFGDPAIRVPVLPRAAWFFLASEPTDLPLPLESPGRGWFISTIDGTRGQALLMVPFAPVILLLNNLAPVRRFLWPVLRKRLMISFQPVAVDLTSWHTYRLLWTEGGCEFWVDSSCLSVVPYSIKGPMGFVCWLDNQYLIARPTGRLRWGTLPVPKSQWLEIKGLKISTAEHETKV